MKREEEGVALTSYTSMQHVKEDFALIDIAEFQHLLQQEHFQLITLESRSLPGGKVLWLGLFART
jgi:hypothetical protein